LFRPHQVVILPYWGYGNVKFLGHNFSCLPPKSGLNRKNL
jgi:hypothetical protein